MDGTIIISYFGGSNNIFADCTSYKIKSEPEIVSADLVRLLTIIFSNCQKVLDE